MITDQVTYHRTPLSHFTSNPFDRPRWFSAAEGLKVVREFIDELEAKLEKCDDDEKARLQLKLQVLRAVDDRLDTIDTHDLKFHFVARDLN
jgi:hypothetical protein